MGFRHLFAFLVVALLWVNQSVQGQSRDSLFPAAPAPAVDHSKPNLAVPSTSGYQKSSLDATKIAGEYFNSIVKILLVDSVAEKRHPGSGYLGRGSGVIVSENGYIFTNRHVIDFCRGFMGYTYYDPSDEEFHTDKDNYAAHALKDPAYITLDYVRHATPIIQVYTDKTGGYKLYVAKVVALDTLNFDGAILKIVSDINGTPPGATFHAVPLGNSDSTRQGEDLCVYGFPAQYEGGLDMMLRDQSTLTFGKNSGNDYVFNSTYGFIKTDASINGGNSGGPVFNYTSKVIGLASKTVDKTSTGLVGGINAMYNMVSLVPDLLVVLKDRGLTKAAKGPEQNSAMLFKPIVAPTARQIRRSNNFKSEVRHFKGGTWYFTYLAPVQQNDKFSFGAIPTYASATTPVNIPVTVSNVNSAELGHLFPLWRFGSFQKLSLDWTIINFTQGYLDYSANTAFSPGKGSNLLLDTNYKAGSFNSSAIYTRYSTAFGLTYSVLIPRFLIIDIYAKAYIAGESLTSSVGASALTGNPVNPALVPQAVLVYNSPTVVLPSVGINIRKGFLMVGMKYTFGNIKTDYSVNGLNTVTTASGNPTPTNFTGSVATGIRQVSTLNFTVGFVINGNKKWKDLLGDQ